MRLFYAICVAVLFVLAAITAYLRSESSSFYGIADTKEMVINDEFAVEIRKIHVVAGQRVTAGDTLVEVKRPELDLKIAEMSRELAELRKQTSAHVDLSRSEVLQHRTEQEALVNDLRGQLRELEVQLETNRALVSELRSIKKGTGDVPDSGLTNPITVKIQQLRKALELALDSSHIGVNRLNSALSYEGEPLVERANGLQKELDLLLEAKQQAFKVAQISGFVGAVCFREGERVSPFTPICSLHTESPSFVRGYIHENAYSQVAVGQKVRVQSIANRRTRVAGDVIGVGARIVEYPVQLRKTPELMVWGREVTIKIPDTNGFLLGEKVLISIAGNFNKISGLPMPGSPVYAAPRAEEFPNGSLTPVLLDILSAGPAGKGGRIEASDVLFLEEMGKYLLVSDDTWRNKPILYFMNDSGRVVNETAIVGLESIKDMEALAQGNDSMLYVLASQSANRKGKLPNARTLFLEVARRGETFTLTGSVRLSEILMSAAREKPSECWAQYLSKAVRDSALDIEGMEFRRGDLFFGIKAPLRGDSAVILRVGDARALFHDFAPARAKIEIWRQWKLADPQTGIPGGISALHFSGDDLYALSVSGRGEKQTSGALWRYRPGDRKPKCIRHFPGLKAEGLARHGGNGGLLITFDNGAKKASQMTIVKVDQ